MARKKKTCVYPNCPNKPRYNVPTSENLKNKVVLYCKTHAKEHAQATSMQLIDILQKRCHYQDCPRQPSFNIPGSSIGRFCVKHKEDGMISVVKVQCDYAACQRKASFNFNNSIPRKPVFCKEHANKGMVNVHKLTYTQAEEKLLEELQKRQLTRRKKEVKNKFRVFRSYKTCKHSSCGKQALFSTTPKQRVPQFCSEHADGENMIDVVSQKCVVCDCKKLPTYGYKTDNIRLYCELHGKERGGNLVELFNISSSEFIN